MSIDEATVTISVSALDELLAKRDAKHEEAMRRLSREVRSTAAAGKGLPADPLGKIFAEHNREHCDPSQPIKLKKGMPGRRADYKAVLQHTRLILDLEFTFEGQKMTFRDLPCSELTPDMVEAWRQQLLITPCYGRYGKPGDGKVYKPYAPATVNRYIGTFQTVISAKVGKRYNPIKGIEREDVEDEGRKGYFTGEAHLNDFLQHCRPLLADMWRVAVNAGGMRKGEVRLLCTSEVDWDEGKIRFAAGLRTKNRRGREFAVCEREMKILRRYRGALEGRGPCSDERCPMGDILAANRENPIHWHVFASPDTAGADPVQDGTLSDWQQDAALGREGKDGVRRGGWRRRLAGNEVPTLHHARHTFATWARIRGEDPEIIRIEAGWRTPSMQARYSKMTRAVFEQIKKLREQSIDAILAELAKREAA